MRFLSQVEKDKISEIASRRAPDLVSIVETIGTRPLSLNDREALRETIADELVEAGLGEDDEPNLYGLALETLIDKLGAI
jgi:hypothetical protein